MDPVAIDVERTLWHSAFSLVCAIVGSSAGLYCLFRLPLMIQLFHPGSFFLALFFCMVLFAWPLVVTELAIGQKFRLSAVPALGLMLHGGRGIAFSSVLIGSLLTAAYSSSALALVVNPGFDQLINRYTSSKSANADPISPGTSNVFFDANNETTTTTTITLFDNYSSEINASYLISTTSTAITTLAKSTASPTAPTGARGGDWLSLLALFIFWVTAAYMSWKFSNHAPLLSRILMPLPLFLWCVLALFASSVVENSDLFRELLLPNAVSLRDGRLWVNAAGQALLLLQVGTGVTITFGSKSKSVHSVVNVSIAIVGVALLFAFFVTVASAGSIAIINNQNFTSSNAAFSDYSSLLTTTIAPRTTAPNAAAAVSASILETVVTNETPTTTEPTTASPAEGTRQLLPRANTYYSAATILPALFVQAGAGSTAFGVIVYIIALVVGVLSMSLLLSSFYNCMADLHVALRSPITSFVAAAVCFAVGAPFAFSEQDDKTQGGRASSAASSIVLLALDQAVVGCCLPVLVLAEAFAVAYGGWGGHSALYMLKEMWTEDLSIGGKLKAAFQILKSFGADARYQNLLSVHTRDQQEFSNENSHHTHNHHGDVWPAENRPATSTAAAASIGVDNINHHAASNDNNENVVVFSLFSRLAFAIGDALVWILPFCLKLFVPCCCTICTVVTIVSFAQNEQKTKAAEIVFALVAVVTGLSVYLVAVRKPPQNQTKPQPWVEMGNNNNNSSNDNNNNNNNDEDDNNNNNNNNHMNNENVFMSHMNKNVRYNCKGVDDVASAVSYNYHDDEEMQNNHHTNTVSLHDLFAVRSPSNNDDALVAVKAGDNIDKFNGLDEIYQQNLAVNGNRNMTPRLSIAQVVHSPPSAVALNNNNNNNNNGAFSPLNNSMNSDPQPGVGLPATTNANNNNNNNSSMNQYPIFHLRLASGGAIGLGSGGRIQHNKTSSGASSMTIGSDAVGGAGNKENARVHRQENDDNESCKEWRDDEEMYHPHK